MWVEEVQLIGEFYILTGGGIPSAGGTPASPVATVHGSAGEAGSGAGSIFAPGVIQITPQDKEAIERVCTRESITSFIIYLSYIYLMGTCSRD